MLCCDGNVLQVEWWEMGVEGGQLKGNFRVPSCAIIFYESYIGAEKIGRGRDLPGPLREPVCQHGRLPSK